MLISLLFSPFVMPKLKFTKINYSDSYYKNKFFKKVVNGNITYYKKRKIALNFYEINWEINEFKPNSFLFISSPNITFTYFNTQYILSLESPAKHFYWEAFLYYYFNTDWKLNTKERIKQCIENYNLIFNDYLGNNKHQINNYYYKILKSKYFNLL
jgi:hypothetical protein